MPEPQNITTPPQPYIVPPDVKVVPNTAENVAASFRAVLRSDRRQQETGRQHAHVARSPIGTCVRNGRGVNGGGSLRKSARGRKTAPARVQTSPELALDSFGEKTLDCHDGPVQVVSNVAPMREQDKAKGQMRSHDNGVSKASTGLATGYEKAPGDLSPLKCFLCGSDTTNEVRRLRNSAVKKFMGISVPDNPFVCVNAEIPPEHVALCRTDEMWIENKWVKDRRYDLAGIWTKRDRPAGGAFANGRPRRRAPNKDSGQTGKQQSRDGSIVEKLSPVEAAEAFKDTRDHTTRKAIINESIKLLRAGGDKDPTDKPDQIGVENTISKAIEVRSGNPRTMITQKRITRLSNGQDEPTPARDQARLKTTQGNGTEAQVQMRKATDRVRSPPREAQPETGPEGELLEPSKRESSDNVSEADSRTPALKNSRTICKKVRDVFVPATLEDQPAESPTKTRRLDTKSSQEQTTPPRVREALTTGQPALRSIAETYFSLIPVKKARSDTEMMIVARPSAEFRSAVLQLQNQNSELRKEILRMRIVTKSHASQLEALNGQARSLLGGAPPTLRP